MGSWGNSLGSVPRIVHTYVSVILRFPAEVLATLLFNLLRPHCRSTVTSLLPQMAASNPEAELIFNRANVALARSQRLIASWLPQTPEPTANTKSEEELKREEDEMFTPVPEK